MCGMSKLGSKQDTKRTLKTNDAPQVKAAKGSDTRGRPSSYTEAIALEICSRLADGESLKSICKDEHMPANATVRAWALDNVEGFSAQYTRARELGYSLLAEEMMAIADTPVVGVKTTSKATGIETTEGDMIEHRRLQVDTRKWMLSKMLPKIYGDKITNELTGKDGKDLVFGLKDVSTDRAKDILTEALSNLAK